VTVAYVCIVGTPVELRSLPLSLALSYLTLVSPPSHSLPHEVSSRTYGHVLHIGIDLLANHGVVRRLYGSDTDAWALGGALYSSHNYI
jgi:hypothetical protein